jgi:DNA-binding Lrp family transcriptional regulator
MAGESPVAKPTKKVVYLEGQNLDSLDEALLAILKLRGGAISVSNVSTTLGVSKENLAQSIDRLQRLGLIERT